MPEPASLDKWALWLNKLALEVSTLNLYRRLWLDWRTAAETANVPLTYIFTFFGETYGVRQAVIIRRCCSGRSTEYGLKYLLNDIRNNPNVPRHRVEPAEVQGDIRSLDAGSLGRIRDYVSKHVAHHEVIPPASIPTHDEIHDAANELAALVQKYVKLVLDEQWSLEPSMSGDVMAPFRMAWLPRRDP